MIASKGETPPTPRSEFLAKFPGRSSLTRLFNKLLLPVGTLLILWQPVVDGKSTWIAVKCSVGQRLSISTFMLFFNGTFPPLSPFLFPSFFQEHFCQWYGDEVFYKVNELSRCEIALFFIYITAGICFFHLLKYTFQEGRNHSEYWVLITYHSI